MIVRWHAWWRRSWSGVVGVVAGGGVMVDRRDGRRPVGAGRGDPERLQRVEVAVVGVGDRALVDGHADRPMTFETSGGPARRLSRCRSDRVVDVQTGSACGDRA